MADRRRRCKVAELVLLLLLLVAVTTLAQLVPISSPAERFALLQLRSSLGLRARDWPRKADPCLVWIGVECGSDGRVIGITVSGLRRTRVGRVNPQFSVDALANFTRLSSFNASGFALPGFIPNWFGSLFALQVLDLRSCSIVGSIPASIGNLTDLNLFYLSNNGLTGSIPQTLGRLSRLSVLDLSQNSFIGSIPSSLSLLRNVTSIDISSNFLSGSIPPALGNLSNLQVLKLSSNRISGSIPAQLGSLSRLVELDLGLNFLFGSVPVDLRRLRSLRRMVVHNNSLTGVLNDNLFLGVNRLQVLVLSYNNLSGSIPSSLWTVPELRFLDVSYNNFSSFLPNISLNANASVAVFNLSHNNFYGNLTSQLRSFSFIDLSDNYFEGPVSNETRGIASLSSNCLQNVTSQKSLDECRSFYSGIGLVFDNFGNPNATIPQPRKKKSNRKFAFILGGVFVGLGFIVLLVLSLVCCLRRRERSNADQRGGGVGPAREGGNLPPAMLAINFSNLGESFTYEQLLRATAEFNDSNLIKHGHSGDLFRGVLENGIPVVIKKVDVRSLKKESYAVELDLFSKASHARLVPLLGHCLEHENEKLLVFKYMPNGDLSNSLYKKSDQEDDSLQSLDWITRLKIAIGAAEGLSFLHHECNPPLVHRDVQASSILLDDKFEVRLGSLSELCTQEGGPHPNVITRLLRFPQISEQSSSGSPSPTCAYDVYCFGKVLLELVTGKLGISASNDAATNEWLEQTLPYINIYERELVTKIVDPSLIVDEDLLEEVWAMAIVARSCLNPKPSKRPLMRYILKALENPLKVVREENSSSARLRTTSSRGSWNAALFGSWRSSSDIGGVPGATNKEGSSSLKQSGTAGSQGSGQGGGGDLSYSNKRLSRDIFPEPAEPTDTERQEED